MADTETPPAPAPEVAAPEPATAGLDPLPPAPAPATAGLDPLPAAPAPGPAAVWPPTKPAQTHLERMEILLTPNMAQKGPKGHMWVPAGEYALFVEQWEERKRARKTPGKLMPPPSSKPRKKTPSSARAARPVYVPEPEPEPEVLDFTGLTEEEIKVKKKEAKRREKARIMAQLAAIEEAKTRLNVVETRAPSNREGKRQARAVSTGEYYTGELSDAQLQAAPSAKKRKTVKQAKRGKDGKVITHRSLKIDEVNENRSWRMKALMRDARECFTQTRKHKYAWVFGKPVDPVALHIPDYFDIIKEPMDFGTVKEKLDKKVYAKEDGGGPMEFAREMRLVFDNCATYNTAESDAGLMGSTLRGEFEKAWLNSKLDEKVAEEDGFRAEEDAIIAATSDEPVEEEVLIESQQVSEVNRQLAEVQKQLAELQKRQAMGAAGGYAPPPAAGGSGGAKRKRSLDDDYFVDEEDIDLDDYIPAPRGGSRRGGGAPRGGGHGGGGGASRSRGGGGGGGGGGGALPSRDMTYREKQELTELLGELPEDKQARVVEIVAERHAELGGNADDLIEINIEELDSVTLWKLDRFVRSCLKPKKKKQTQEELLLEAQRAEQEAERELMQVEASLGVGAPAPSAKTPSVSAPAKGADGDATSSSSDSGSSDSDSDSDSYDSAEGGGSNPKGGPAAANGGAAAAAGAAAPGGAAAVEVSSSRPTEEGVALKQNASKAPVTVQNQAGWANLADKTAAAPKEGAEAAQGAAAAIPDALWSDFEAMAQRKTEREKEREAEDAAARAAAEAKEAAALADEQRKRDAVAEKEAAARRAEEEAEAAKKRAVEEERAKARAELDAAGQTVDMEGQREAMKEFEG